MPCYVDDLPIEMVFQFIPRDDRQAASAQSTSAARSCTSEANSSGSTKASWPFLRRLWHRGHGIFLEGNWWKLWPKTWGKIGWFSTIWMAVDWDHHQLMDDFTAGPIWKNPNLSCDKKRSVHAINILCVLQLPPCPLVLSDVEGLGGARVTSDN